MAKLAPGPFPGTVIGNGVVFSNKELGTVTVVAGSLALWGGGTSSGTFDVKAHALLNFGVGPHTLTDKSKVSGDGNVLFSGFADVYGTYMIGGITWVSKEATVNFVNDVGTLFFDNSGTVTIGTGTTFTVGGDFTQSGTTYLNGGMLTPLNLVLGKGSSFSGVGVITADVKNSGTLSVGDDGSTGILEIFGDYTQTASGTLKLKLGGTTPGITYDQLNIHGKAILDGILIVTPINSFDPTGSTFNIVSYSSSTGMFAVFAGPGILSDLIPTILQLLA